MTRLETAYSSAITWVVTALLGGIVWLVRRVLTNQAELDILKRELANRERLRQEDRERMAQMESDIRDIRNYTLGRR
jgi:hypothetical protein